MKPPICFITGPPAAGKSSLAVELASRFLLGIAIHMDDLREWVVQGIAHPIEWTEETTRQFQLALDAAVDIAVRYNDAGFAVIIEHCHQPPQVTEAFESRLADRRTYRLVLAPNLVENHHRNRSRTTKSFESSVLDKSIEALNPLYRSEHPDLEGYWKIDNSTLTVQETADRLLAAMTQTTTC